MSAIQEPPPPTATDNDLGAELYQKAIEFPLGLPGFNQERRYVLTQTPQERPFSWLRSLDNENLAFATIEAYQLVPDYTIDIADEELVSIGQPSPKECAILLILRVEVDAKSVKIYANLRAPVILNTSKRLARQIILPDADNYSESTLFEFSVKK